MKLDYKNYRNFVVAELYGGGYDWEAHWLLKDENGKFYTYTESGCSCYGPFDSPVEWSDMIPVNNVDEALRNAPSESSYYYNGEEIATFRNEIRQAFKGG